MTNRLILLVPLGLAACNSSPTVTATNASVEEVSNKVAAASADGQFLSPGRWETTMKIDEMSMPGLPPAVAEKAKARMAQARVITSCLTPEEAKAPKGSFFGAERGCTYDHYTMGGGNIDAKMVCRTGGQTRTMTLVGKYGPDTYHMTVNSTGSGGAGPMAGMSVRMTMDAKRAGECTGKEDG